MELSKKIELSGKIEYLNINLDKQINWFDKNRQSNKKKAFWLKMTAVSFSAATTILLGLKGVDNTTLADLSVPLILGNSALILSTLVTLFNAFDAFFNPKSVWIRYTITSNQLKAVRSKLEYLTSNKNISLDEQVIDELYKEFQSVLDETNNQWLLLRRNTEVEK